MRIPRATRRVVVALAASGAVSAAVLGATMASASASTIPYQHVEVCAQGNYTAWAEFPTRGGFETTAIAPGTCWYQAMPPFGATGSEPVNVYGVWNTDPGQSFYIGTEYYNPEVSGIGIGAEGVTTSPYLWTW
jgi:hypothetical protein